MCQAAPRNNDKRHALHIQTVPCRVVISGKACDADFVFWVAMWVIEYKWAIIHLLQTGDLIIPVEGLIIVYRDENEYQKSKKNID